MFETLEDMFEKSKPPMDPGWPVLTHSMDALFGLLYVIMGREMHQPLGVAVGAIVFLLSLIWLISTIRSPLPVSRRDLRVRSRIVLWILMTFQTAYMVAGHSAH